MNVKSPAPETPLPAFIVRQIVDYRYFFLNLTAPPEGELTVVCGGWTHCAPDYRVDRGDFEFYGLECIVQGKTVNIIQIQRSTHARQDAIPDKKACPFGRRLALNLLHVTPTLRLICG